jgi:DNA-directed RNA polymerase specialized sigma24 family protein
MPRETPVPEFWVRNEKQPSTPMQALMEAAPGEDPELSVLEEKDSLMERGIALFEDVLEPDELEILRMHYVKKMSIRDIADAMGTSKDTLHRKLGPLKEWFLLELQRMAKEKRA